MADGLDQAGAPTAGAAADPGVLRAYRFWCAAASGPLTVAEMRHGYGKIFGGFPVPGDAVIEEIDAGVRSLRVTSGSRPPAGTIVYFHGGGYICGDPEGVRQVAAHLAREVPAEVLVPDYRLAPEHPHPAAVEDAVAAYRYVLASGRPPDRVALAGDSAGGGLALATMVSLAAHGLPLPAAAVCFSPWLDLALTGDSYVANAATDTTVDLATIRLAADAYLAGQDPGLPTASPLMADLAGFPPLLVQVGAGEMLLDDARRLACRCEQAGVAVTLEVVPDVPHVYQLFTPTIPEARASVERAAGFLARCLDGDGT